MFFRRAFPSAVVMAAACGLSQAQSSVTVYGIVDVGVEALTNVNAAGDSLLRMPNLTGTTPSRLGFRGAEDLGDGLRAVFALESGFAPDTGTLNNGGRLWGRFAYVGLAGDWGSVTLGRLVNMTFNAALSETLGGNLYSIASLDSYIPNARSDNAIGYLGTFNGFTAGATYSFGRDSVSGAGPAATNCPGESADRKACRQVTAMLKYDSPDYGAALSADLMNGGPGATLGLDDSSATDRRTVFSGYGVVGEVKVSGGLVRRERRAAVNFKSDLWYVGATFRPTPALVLDAEVARLDVKNSPNDSTLLALRAANWLSKRTSVYLMAGHMWNAGSAALSISAGGTVGAGLGQTGVAAGIRHDF